MNTPGTPLHIDIVSDVVCPWCFIGAHRLAAATQALRAARPGARVALRWLPYFLNPDTPVEGEPYRPFLEMKFGGPAKLAQLWARLEEAGASAGVEFAFERIAVRPNTLRAHRLIHRAQQQGGEAGALVEALFRAHFQRGEHIGEVDALARIAAEAGVDTRGLAEYLAGDEDADEVREQARRALEIGVSGVPCFLIGGRLAVAGAQPPAVLEQAMRRVLDEAAA